MLSFPQCDGAFGPRVDHFSIQQLLVFILDLVVTALAVILVAIVVTWKGSFNAGAVGVSLVTIMTFNRTLMFFVKYWTLLETSIGAVARVKTFVENTAEEEDGKNCQTIVPPNWPTFGAIEYQNSVASYKPGAEPVLKGLGISDQLISLYHLGQSEEMERLRNQHPTFYDTHKELVIDQKRSRDDEAYIS